MKRSLRHLFSLGILAISSFGAWAQCPSGALTMMSSITIINNGEVYCASSDVNITGTLTINPGGALYIETGVEVSISGNFTVNDGKVEVFSGGGIYSTGAIQLGSFGSQKEVEMILHDYSYAVTDGSFSANDPSFNGIYSQENKIKMGDGAVFEVCGTFTQQSTTYPLMDYIGSGEPSYFIVSAPASGGGSSELTHSNNINWITMGSVSNLDKGNASWSGANAQTEAVSNIPWPEGLTGNGRKCGEAKIIAENLSTLVGATPPVITNPMLYQRVKNNYL